MRNEHVEQFSSPASERAKGDLAFHVVRNEAHGPHAGYGNSTRPTFRNEVRVLVEHGLEDLLQALVKVRTSGIRCKDGLAEADDGPADQVSWPEIRPA